MSHGNQALDRLRGTPGSRLLGARYWASFEEDFWQIDKSGFWKLERMQHFQEPNDESWVAFSEGDWQKAMGLLRKRRPALKEHYRKISARGFETWRIRVVEEPLTAYMQWELQLLLLRHELGGHTRVVHADALQQWETHGHLPELFTLGNSVAYVALYDETGLQQGGVRYADRKLVKGCRESIQELYRAGTPIAEYVPTVDTR